MKFEIGDKIIVLHSGENGSIVDFINKEMVLVEVEGIQFPIYLDQIDFPYFTHFSQSRLSSGKKIKTRGEEIPSEIRDAHLSSENGVFLSFLPVHQATPFGEEIKLLKINLVNQTNQIYKFGYKMFIHSGLFLEIHNDIHPFTSFYLQNILLDQLNDKPRMEFQFSILEKNGGDGALFEKEVKLKPKEIFKKIHELLSREDATFIYLIFQTFPKPSQPFNTRDLFPKISHPLEAHSGKNINYFSGLELPPYEVDLHIEKILPNWKGLTSFEILMFQLREFQRCLDLSIAHQQFSMVAIHGVGKGKLKEEIHKILSKTKEVRNFVNQYDVRYGYGATEIFFQF